MSILPIRVLGDPVLREETKRVETFTPELRQLIDDNPAPKFGTAAS